MPIGCGPGIKFDEDNNYCDGNVPGISQAPGPTSQAAYFGFWGAAAGTVLLGGGGLAVLGRQAQRMARTLRVSEEGVEAETHTGRAVRIPWGELGALEIFDKPTVRDR